MGETLTNSAMFYADLLDHYQDLLVKHYHHLTRVIRPHLFYGWLRGKGAFTQSDQEEVENKYVTNCMKAGCLIDIISTKGQSGFIAFLEVVEYEYGDLFLEITGKQPRMPPREFTPNPSATIYRDESRRQKYRPRTSADVLAMIGELAYGMTQQIASKSEELRRLRNLVDNMQTEQDQEAEENSMMYADLKAARETIADLKQSKAEQLKRYRQLKDEKEKLQAECSNLREQKDSFMAQCHQLRDKIANLEQFRSIRRQQAEDEAKRGQKFPKTDFISVKQTTTCKPVVKPPAAEFDVVKHAQDKIKKLKEELKEHEMNKIQLIDEKKELEEKLSDLKYYQDNFEQIKQERDKALKECEELTKKYSNMTTKNEQLSEECHRYMEEFKRMEEIIKNLKREIAERNRQGKATEAAAARVPVNLSHRQLQNRAKLLQHNQNRVDDFDGPKVQLRESSVKSLGSDPPHPLLKRATPLFAEKEKRKASYMTAFPLVVFAPETVQQHLFDFLLQYFDVCQGEASGRQKKSADVATEQVVICEKKSPDGTTYSVTVDQLKKCLAQSKSTVLVPTVQAVAIASMRQQDIEPLVVIVKFKNEYDCTELSAIEEALDHIKGHYETVVVSESLADDFPRFSQHVLREVSRLVDKYSFLIGLGCSM